MADESDTVTPSEAMQAWYDDYRNMTDAELAGLTHEGQWLHDRNAGVLVQVIDEPVTFGPEPDREVVCKDQNSERVEYRLDHIRSYITNGEVEPIPERVVEHAEEIAIDVAAYELGQLDTLSRDMAYSVVNHLETVADARNAVRLAQLDRYESTNT